MELAPTVGFATEATDRKRIDKFVRVDAGPAAGGLESSSERVMPMRAPSQERLLFGPEWCGGFHKVKRRAQTAPPCQAIEDRLCQVSFARAQLDQVAAAGGLQGLSGPCGDGFAKGGAEHGSGGEVSASSHPPDAAGIVAAFGVMEGQVHEAIEAQLPAIALIPWPKRGIHRGRLDGVQSLSHFSREVKVTRIAAILLLSFASCERNAGPHAEHTSAAQSSTQAGGAKDQPETKGKDDPVLIGKKPPVAEPVQGQPGMVISPFNGRQIDVKGIPPGTLVADPTYPLEDKKYFRVPELPEGTGEPPKLLDPGILIRPNPPKEEPKKEEP